MQLQKVALPLGDLMSMGKAFAESGMFPDSTKAAQAIVKIQAGQEMGISPFASMSGIHMIKGKPTIGANIMASCVKRSGKYNYKVKEMTDKICSIDFYEGEENIGNSTFTIEDAKKAGTQNLEKFPRNMLFARAISNGVKWFTPDVFEMPVYTPEEMGNFSDDTEDTTHEVVEWQLPPETAKEIGSLIETSTLDANGKVVAANSLLNAKNQGEVDKIKTRLLKLQSA